MSNPAHQQLVRKVINDQMEVIKNGDQSLNNLASEGEEEEEVYKKCHGIKEGSKEHCNQAGNHIIFIQDGGCKYFCKSSHVICFILLVYCAKGQKLVKVQKTRKDLEKEKRQKKRKRKNAGEGQDDSGTE